MRRTLTALLVAFSGFVTPAFAGQADWDDPKPAAERASNAQNPNPPVPDPGVREFAGAFAKAALSAAEKPVRPILVVRRK